MKARRSTTPVPLKLALVLALCGASIASRAWAEGQFIDIAPKTEAEIRLVLDTLDSSIRNAQNGLPPIVMMLHGNEAHRFLRRSYAANKTLVDQTAKLAAYQVIKVQICALWMQENDYQSDDLFPFVSVVPFGAGELGRLSREEDYSEYTVDL